VDDVKAKTLKGIIRNEVEGTAHIRTAPAAQASLVSWLQTPDLDKSVDFSPHKTARDLRPGGPVALHRDEIV